MLNEPVIIITRKVGSINAASELYLYKEFTLSRILSALFRSRFVTLHHYSFFSLAEEGQQCSDGSFLIKCSVCLMDN